MTKERIEEIKTRLLAYNNYDSHAMSENALKYYCEDVSELLDALESETKRTDKAADENNYLKIKSIDNFKLWSVAVAERDCWKVQAEALERSIRHPDSDLDGFCYACINEFECNVFCEHGSAWQFDQARFSENNGGAE